MSPSPQILVVGAGNEYMSDDGVGVYVVETLQQMSPAHIACRNCGTDLLKIASENRLYQSVIIVDAIRSGDEPGSIHWFAPVDLSSYSSSQSVHQLSSIENLLLIPLMNANFRQTRFYLVGIEPGDLHQGAGLSRSVQNSADRIIKLLQSKEGVNQVINQCFKLETQ